MGSYDIYYCTKDEKGQWTNPVNMGAPINTSLEEKKLTSPKMEKQRLVLIMTSKSRGCGLVPIDISLHALM